MAFSTYSVRAVTFASSITANDVDVGASNANKIIWVYATSQSGSTQVPTTCTVAGSSATAFGAQGTSAYGLPYQVFQINASAISGVITVSVSYSSGAGKPEICVISYDDCGTVGTPTVISQAGASPSFVLNGTASGRTVVALTSSDNSTALTMTAGTARGQTVSSQGTRFTCADIVSSGTTATISGTAGATAWTWRGLIWDIDTAASPPSFTVQPSNQTVTAPATATFTATSTGTPTITHQWQRSTNGGGAWSDLVGETGVSYTTPATTVSGGSANNGDQYRRVDTNGSGTTNSNAATLTVNPAPATNPIRITFNVF